MPRPSNGYMRCTRRKIRGRFPLGTKCKLKCRNGYTPSGYMRKKCVETGYWVGTDATCEDEKRLRVVTSKSTTTTTVLFNDELFHYKYLANHTSKEYFEKPKLIYCVLTNRSFLVFVQPFCPCNMVQSNLHCVEEVSGTERFLTKLFVDSNATAAINLLDGNP